MGNRDCSQSIKVPLCCSFFLTVFPCTSVGSLHGLQSFMISLLGCGHSMGCRKYLPAPACGPPWAAGSTSYPSFFTGLGVHGVVSHTFFLIILHCPLVFLPFLKYVFLMALSAWLMGSAMSCGGSVVELSGSGHVQHGAAPGFFSRRTPL